MNLLRMLYVSTAKPGTSASDLSAILNVSRMNNAKRNITGVLCYKSGHFAQILEGEELTVLDSYLRIARDSRHSDLMIVSLTTTAHRMFGDWVMGRIGEESLATLDVQHLQDLRTSSETGRTANDLMQQWLKLLQAQTTREA